MYALCDIQNNIIDDVGHRQGNTHLRDIFMAQNVSNIGKFGNFRFQI